MNVIFRPLLEASLPSYEEMKGSPVERIVEDNFESTRTLKCSWTRAEELAVKMLGRTQYYSPNTMVYFLGHYYPHTVYGTLRAQSVFVKPFGKTGSQASGVTNYDYAIVTVTYRAIPRYFIDSLRDEEMNPSAEYLTKSSEGFFWDAALTKPVESDSAPNKITAMLEWTYILKNQPFVSSNVFNYLGRANTVAMYSPKYSYTFNPETVLYLGPELEEEQTMFSERRWTVRLRFKWRPEGWNKFYKPGVEVPQYIHTAVYSPFAVYGPADLNYLLLWEL